MICPDVLEECDCETTHGCVWDGSLQQRIWDAEEIAMDAVLVIRMPEGAKLPEAFTEALLSIRDQLPEGCRAVMAIDEPARLIIDQLLWD